MRVTTCPSRDQLLAFSVGKLPVETLETVADHLTACPTCESVLSKLDSVPDSFLSSLDQSLAGSPFAHEPACRAVLARFEAVGRPQPPRTHPADTPPPAPLGQLGYYDVLEKLGQGGMGTVFKARHRKLDKVVAVKVLRAERMQDAAAVARFEREIQAIGQLEHPHIVRATDAGEADGMHFLVMEFVEGTDLARLVTQRGPLPIPDACELIRQAAVGLQHVAEHGQVHRDIKPSNLLVTRDGQLKIADLGLALLQGKSTGKGDLTSPGLIVGTLDYLAPEQALNTHEVDIRADLYSLGCTLYHLLAGQAPFGDVPSQLPLRKTLAHAQLPVPPLRTLRPEVPEPLEAVVHRLLAKNPAERFATPQDVAAVLVPFTAGSDLAGLVGRLQAEVESSATLCPSGTAPSAPSPIHGADTPLPAPSRSGKRWRRAVGVLMALGLALGAWQVGPAVYRIATNQGVLVIKTDDPDVRVSVRRDGEEVTILDGRSKHRVTVSAGTYELQLTEAKDSLKLRSERLTLERNGQQIIEVYFEPTVATPQREEKPGPGVKLGFLDQLDAAQIPAAERFAWQPKELVAVLGRHAGRHWGEVTRVAFSPDGKYAASAGVDGNVCLWDPETLRELSRLEGAQAWPVRGLAFSRDGKRLAAHGGQSGEQLMVWHVPSCQLVLNTGLSHFHSQRSLAFVGNGPHLIAHRHDRLLLVHSADGRWEREILLPAGRILAVAASPDGRQALTGLNGEPMRLWDLKSGKEICRFEPHSAGINCIVFTPDGRHVLCGNAINDRKIAAVRLWDVESGKEVRTFTGHSALITDIALSIDGCLAATASEDGTVRIWDVGTGQELRRLPHSQYRVTCVAFSPDGKRLLSGSEDRALRLWDVHEGVEVSAVRVGQAAIELCGNVALSPDGRHLLTGHANTRNVRLWDVASGKVVRSWDSPPGSSSVAFSPDGRQVLIGTWGSFWLRRLDGDEPVFYRPRPTEEDGHPTTLAFLPDGEQMLVSTGRFLRLFEKASGRELRRFEGSQNGICQLALSADGLRALTGGPDKSVRLWDVTSAKELAHIEVDNEVNAVAFAPDGRRAACAGLDGLVRLLEVGDASLRETAVLRDHRKRVWALAFVLDGTALASADHEGHIILWQTASREKAAEWRLPGPVTALTVAADGRHLLTGNQNGTVYILRLAPGG